MSQALTAPSHAHLDWPEPRTHVIAMQRSDGERLASLGRELDALKARISAQIGPSDLAYVKRLDRFSRVMEAAGRLLIHFSFEPIAFGVGVLALWVHKQLQATEIGHTALHGAYDKLPEAASYASKRFAWDLPIDEASWRQGHNLKHHGNTNVAGKDPDLEYGPVRLSPRTPHRFEHYFQLPFTLAVIFPNFALLMNLHFAGVLDRYYAKSGLGESVEVQQQRARQDKLRAWLRALRKYGPYYLKNFVFFPALAGPMFWKVLLGNWLAEVLRDVYSAATIYCGHVGADVHSYPVGTKPASRGEWYAMQIASANDFEVSRPVSILCGGLDRQIEHHLFPTLPPERLRQIAPEVRRICERHGLEYKTGSWPATLAKSLTQIATLSRRGGFRQVLRSMD
jgi:NADPH-dependent stearoyl-CoA 9-desaturase